MIEIVLWGLGLLVAVIAGLRYVRRIPPGVYDDDEGSPEAS